MMEVECQFCSLRKQYKAKNKNRCVEDGRHSWRLVNGDGGLVDGQCMNCLCVSHSVGGDKLCRDCRDKLDEADE